MLGDFWEKKNVNIHEIVHNKQCKLQGAPQLQCFSMKKCFQTPPTHASWKIFSDQSVEFRLATSQLKDQLQDPAN